MAVHPILTARSCPVTRNIHTPLTTGALSPSRAPRTGRSGERKSTRVPSANTIGPEEGWLITARGPEVSLPEKQGPKWRLRQSVLHTFRFRLIQADTNRPPERQATVPHPEKPREAPAPPPTVGCVLARTVARDIRPAHSPATPSAGSSSDVGSTRRVPACMHRPPIPFPCRPPSSTLSRSIREHPWAYASSPPQIAPSTSVPGRSSASPGPTAPT